MDPYSDNLVKERLSKLENIRKENIEPYPYSFEKISHSTDIHASYSNLQAGEHGNKNEIVAGRIMQLRRMGKVTFIHISDKLGKLQLYLTKDKTKDYLLLKQLDIGDFIGCEGLIFKTKTGEVTVEAGKFTLLSKSIRPLPEKFHGLVDPELRYRMRYLDFLMNPEVKDIFFKRSQIISEMRAFLLKHKYTEFEVPALQTIYGGANAKPFKTHLHALNLDLYLSISPELFLKRLIVGGFERVFSIGKNFRNEGLDRRHNPEFTMLEFYQAYADYNDMMTLTEQMIATICKILYKTTKVTFQGHELDFKTPWNKLTMIDSIKKYASIDVKSLSDDDLLKLRTTYNIQYDGDLNRGKMIELLFDELVSEKLIQPVHIINHPKESTPLCKANRDNPALIERFESYVAGIELTNGYSELNDPILQRTLLKEQAALLRAGQAESHPMDEDFINAIEIGMPPTGGVGIGVDRLVMFLTDSPSIRDVIAFPTMKPVSKDK